MNSIIKGNYSRFTHESKFDHGINTHLIASKAILEGDMLREKLRNRRILNTIVKINDRKTA